MSAAEPDLDDDLDWHCYKHPDRSAGVRCRRCERAICPDCMVTAPVGFQCRSCVKDAPAVRTMRSMRRDPVVTWVLIGVNAAVAVLATSVPGTEVDYGLFGPLVAEGEWWRVVTSGFLHQGLFHLAMNMLLLYQLGTLLEPALGRVRFGVLYAAALLAGSLGVLVLDPTALTVGASGAVYGLLGASILVLRRQGIAPMQSGLGGLLVINLVLTFAIPGISIGGHIGGLLGGGLAALVLLALDDRPAVGSAAVAALAGMAGLAALAVAANPL